MRAAVLWLLTCACSEALRGPAGGGGKKNKPAASSPKSSRPAPRRITSVSTQSSGISLKTQLKLVRALKKPPVAAAEKKTSHRQKKKTASKSAALRDSYDDLDERLYDKPLLVVDGYNVIFGCDELRDLSTSEDLAAARRRLVEDVSRLATVRKSSYDGAVVVFDGRDRESFPADQPNVDVVFTEARYTADAEIEKVAAQRRPLGDGATHVVSNDNLVRLMADAMGAHVSSVAAFEGELRGARIVVSQALENLRDANKVQRLLLQRDPLPDEMNRKRRPAREDTQASADAEEAFARKRDAVQTGLQKLLRDLDSVKGDERFLSAFLLREDVDGARRRRCGDKLRRLRELDGVIGDFGLGDWLHHQKLLNGLTCLMVDDWWTHPAFAAFFEE